MFALQLRWVTELNRKGRGAVPLLCYLQRGDRHNLAVSVVRK